MFGWRKLNHFKDSRVSFGFKFDVEDKGAWLFVYFGKWRLAWVRYAPGVNRFTGPEENRGVLAYFFGGAERRAKGSAFEAGFAAAASKPLPPPINPAIYESLRRMNNQPRRRTPRYGESAFR